MATIINGKEISQNLKQQIADEVTLLNKKGVNVCLAVIIVGEDPASQIYVRNKERSCQNAGIKSIKIALPESVSEQELLKTIDKLNKNNEVNGILCQLPLPKHINEKNIINAILPQKDVDAFHPQNVGKIMIGDYDFLPCTPAGIMELIKSTGIETKGKNCTIVGRSNIVGKPMAMLMLHADATVTVCHSKTVDLAEKTRQADILIAAVGVPEFIKANMVKKGAVVIDVGINRTEEGMCGDVDFNEVEPVCSAITPVPGGVGPMTIALLLKNTVTAAKKQNGLLK